MRTLVTFSLEEANENKTYQNETKYIYTYIHIYISVYKCIYVCVYVCTYIYKNKRSDIYKDTSEVLSQKLFLTTRALTTEVYY